MKFINQRVIGLLACAAVLPALADAKAVQLSQVPLSNFIKHIESLEKTRTLTPQEQELKMLSGVAVNVVNADTVKVSGRADEPECFARIRIEGLIESIRDRINSKVDWKPSLSKDAFELVAKNRVNLEKIFASDSYSWAWFQTQVGEQEAAKKTLSALYMKEFLRVMALKRAVFGMGPGPMGDVEFIYKALEPMASVEEKLSMNEKMKKMKIHVSNLPQSHIVT